MAIVDEVERIKRNIENIYAEAENKGAVITGERNSDNLANVVNTIPTGGSVEKGMIITECDATGYVSKAKIVGLKTVPDYAFYIYSIGTATILNMKIKELDFSESTSIGSGACYNCSTLEKVIFSNKLTSVGSSAFRGATSLKNDTLPDSIVYVNDYAFYECDLRISKLPDSAKYLYSACFYGNPNMKIKEIPAIVTRVYTYAFGGCTSITELDIKTTNSLTLDGDCFRNSGLEKLIIRTTNASIGSTSLTGTPIGNGNGFIYVPDESISTYQTKTNWSKFASQIKGLSELGG